MHTNPILICFCSILYYRELAEQIRRYRIEKEIVKAMDSISSDGEIYFSLKAFTGKLRNEPFEPLKGKSSPRDQFKIYKKHILNRWHLFLRLTLNKELIVYRGHNLKDKVIVEQSSMLKKMMLLCKKK